MYFYCFPDEAPHQGSNRNTDASKQYEQGRRPGSEHGLEAASTYTEAKTGQTEHTQ
jgi:hypothetical protein